MGIRILTKMKFKNWYWDAMRLEINSILHNYCEFWLDYKIYVKSSDIVGSNYEIKGYLLIVKFLMWFIFREIYWNYQG